MSLHVSAPVAVHRTVEQQTRSGQVAGIRQHYGTQTRWGAAASAPVPVGLRANRIEFDGLSCYSAGRGSPVLMVHGADATSSAAQLRPVFDHLRSNHAVFALDLPGYGFSQRSARDYTPRLMTDAVHAALAQIRQRCGPGPVDAVGVALGCEFLARAAVEAPHSLRRLAFVSPTGLNGHKSLRAAPGTTREWPLVHALLTRPGWGPWLYRQLTRQGVVRHFLQRSWGSHRIDETLCCQAVLNARVEGAWNAPLQFVSGRLFSADIHTVYEQVRQPVWLSHGVRGNAAVFRVLDDLPALKHWRHSVMPTGALPFFEQPEKFAARLERFLAENHKDTLS